MPAWPVYLYSGCSFSFFIFIFNFRPTCKIAISLVRVATKSTGHVLSSTSFPGSPASQHDEFHEKSRTRKIRLVYYKF